MGTLQQKLGFIGPQRCYRQQEVMLKRLSQALLYVTLLRSLPYPPALLMLITNWQGAVVYYWHRHKCSPELPAAVKDAVDVWPFIIEGDDALSGFLLQLVLRLCNSPVHFPA